MLPRQHQQFPGLDAVRAMAALSILVVHAALLKGVVARGHGVIAHLDIGVPFFFLLSAFLLYRPFVAARVAGRPRPGFGRYGERRFLRVIPAYWVALTVGAIVPALAGAFSGNWWVYYGLLQNFPVYTATGRCAIDPFRCGIPTAWSLSVEIGFYLMLPLLVLLTDRVARGRRWLRGELAVLAVLFVASLAVLWARPFTDLWLWLFFSPIGHGAWFAFGLALAALSVWVEQRAAEPRLVGFVRRRPGVTVVLGAALYLLASLAWLRPGPSLNFPLLGRWEYIGEFLLFGLIAALVLIPLIFARDGGGLTRRVFTLPFMSWLGLVSYGIFLWQFPVMILLLDHGPSMSFPPFLAISIAGSVACGAASYYLVERPLMRVARRRRPVPAPAPASG